ncbi:MAG TPA: methyltransferase domain-containing protein [Actinomycetes bacterium]|jgi:hypothetical protein|nr:methyltransferase domain-containing protein [Actinomycetes bacterium]
MDRQAWLRERRRSAEERHDTIHAFTYDDQWGEIGATHRRFLADLIQRCPPGGTILDAACGTGKYFGMILDAGRRVVGTDQSVGMLSRARARFPAVPTEKVGLQELSFAAEWSRRRTAPATATATATCWPAGATHTPPVRPRLPATPGQASRSSTVPSPATRKAAGTTATW